MAPVIAWTIPATSRPEWELTVVRPKPDERLDDAELVAACLNGEAGAFDLIVSRHQRAVYQLCYRFAGNHEDASDLSQDVFVRAYRGLRNFRGQSSLGTWLYRIGVNVCLNRAAVKRLQTEPIDERQHVDTSTESPTDRMLRVERAERVRAAIAELPPKQRAALILRMYHDMSHQDIAGIVGSSEGAVKANVFHALQNLKKILGSKKDQSS
jgi:RNA polymerase sigma-70 factor, ECF subfamily